MLVLNRRVGEQIVIGDGEVVIDILEQKPGSIKLGFHAVRSISIDRAEIHRRKKELNKEQQYVG